MVRSCLGTSEFSRAGDSSVLKAAPRSASKVELPVEDCRSYFEFTIVDLEAGVVRFDRCARPRQQSVHERPAPVGVLAGGTRSTGAGDWWR